MIGNIPCCVDRMTIFIRGRGSEQRVSAIEACVEEADSNIVIFGKVDPLGELFGPKVRFS